MECPMPDFQLVEATLAGDAKACSRMIEAETGTDPLSGWNKTRDPVT